MSVAFGLLSGLFSKKTSRNDDDFADRLNHRFTTLILVLFAGTLAIWKLAGMSKLLLSRSNK